jgi:hypothetical protein
MKLVAFKKRFMKILAPRTFPECNNPEHNLPENFSGFFGGFLGKAFPLTELCCWVSGYIGNLS